MEQTDVIGINEEKLDQLIMEIGDIADRINNKFNLLENLVSESSSFFECEAADRYRNNFNLIKVNFAIVNKNILAMSSELVKAKARLYNIEDEVKIEFSKQGGSVISNSLQMYDRNK